MVKKVQLTIYDFTGETDPVCLKECMGYFLRKFNKKGKKNEKI